MANTDEDRYVVPAPNGGWDVVKKAHERASGHFETQAEAIERAREIVAKTGRGRGELRIMDEDGRFRDSDSGARNETDAKDTR